MEIAGEYRRPGEYDTGVNSVRGLCGGSDGGNVLCGSGVGLGGGGGGCIRLARRCVSTRAADGAAWSLSISTALHGCGPIAVDGGPTGPRRQLARSLLSGVHPLSPVRFVVDGRGCPDERLFEQSAVVSISKLFGETCAQGSDAR